MPVSKAPWLAGGIAACSVALMAAGLVLAFLDRHLVPASQTNWDAVDVLSVVEGVTVAVISSVVAARRPANPIPWLGATAGLVLCASTFATSYALRGGVAAPGSLPAWHAAAWLENWVWGIPTAAAAFLFLLFPTGRLRSRRWRPAAWFVAAIFCVLMVASAVNATRHYDQPFASFAAQQTPGGAPLRGVARAGRDAGQRVRPHLEVRQIRRRGAAPDEVARTGGRRADRRVRPRRPHQCLGRPGAAAACLPVRQRGHRDRGAQVPALRH